MAIKTAGRQVTNVSLDNLHIITDALIGFIKDFDRGFLGYELLVKADVGHAGFNMLPGMMFCDEAQHAVLVYEDCYPEGDEIVLVLRKYYNSTAFTGEWGTEHACMSDFLYQIN